MYLYKPSFEIGNKKKCLPDDEIQLQKLVEWFPKVIPFGDTDNTHLNANGRSSTERYRNISTGGSSPERDKPSQ